MKRKEMEIRIGLSEPMSPKEEKREQAPALQVEFSTKHYTGIEGSQGKLWGKRAGSSFLDIMRSATGT